MEMTGLVFVIDKESDPDGQSATMRSIEGVKAQLGLRMRNRWRDSGNRATNRATSMLNRAKNYATRNSSRNFRNDAFTPSAAFRRCKRAYLTGRGEPTVVPPQPLPLTFLDVPEGRLQAHKAM